MRRRFRLSLSRFWTKRRWSFCFLLLNFQFSLSRFRVDEHLALKLHFEKALAPYSFTPVEALQGQLSSFIYERFNGSASMRFTVSIFEPTLMKTFTQALLSTGPPSVDFVDVQRPITEISVNQKDSKKIMEEAKPIKRFKVVYRTSCYFMKSVPTDLSNRFLKALKSPNRSVPLHDVSLMLRNLTRLWRKFPAANFPYRDYVT